MPLDLPVALVESGAILRSTTIPKPLCSDLLCITMLPVLVHCYM